MKKRNRIDSWQFTLALMYFVLVLAGCASEQPLPIDEPGQQPRPVQLSVQIGDLNTRAALSGSNFPHETQANVIMVDFDGKNDKHNKAFPYIYKNPTGAAGVWMPVDLDNPLEANYDPAQLLMHYPATLPTGSSLSIDKRILTPAVAHTASFGDLTGGTYNGENSFFLTPKPGDPTQEVFLADGEIDYLTGGATTECTSAASAVNIIMKHALCMVVFHVYKMPENTNPGAVTTIRLENVDAANGPLRKGTFQLKDRTFTPADRVSYKRTLLNFPDGSYYGIMAYPATIADAGSVRVTFTIDGRDYPLLLPAKEWRSGNVILYNVKLKATSAQLDDNIGLIDWATGTENEFVIQ